MENALENKTKLFAIYYGQQVRCFNDQSVSCLLWHVDSTSMYHVEQYFLQLKSLASITDEDAVAVDFFTSRHFNRVLESYGANFNDLLLKHHHIDYLRSKGYALPWMGLSVEKQIEYNWIKIC